MIEAEINTRKYDPYALNIAVPKGFYKEIDVTRFEFEDNSINEEFSSEGDETIAGESKKKDEVIDKGSKYESSDEKEETKIND